MGKPWVGLTVVFLFVLAIRLYSAFHTPFLSSDDAYLEVRSVESILHGNVLWHDPLGYGGRTLIRSPVFDAILAFFGLFMPLPLVFKIIPNIFRAYSTHNIACSRIFCPHVQPHFIFNTRHSAVFLSNLCLA